MIRFAGRLAPNVATIYTFDNTGTDLVTFVCGHVRTITMRQRDLLVDAGGHPVCLVCDGAPKAQAAAESRYPLELKAMMQHVTTIEQGLKSLEHRYSERLNGLETQTGKHAEDLDAARKTCINILQAVGDTGRVKGLETQVRRLSQDGEVARQVCNALAERLQKLEAKSEADAGPPPEAFCDFRAGVFAEITKLRESFVPYHPVPPASGWCHVCQRPPLWAVLVLAVALAVASATLGLALGGR